jgi:hypothetical protein
MNPLGSKKEIVENKLILLYLINKINLPVSNLQITKLILENKFMNYFLLQQFLAELCESKFLDTITSDGKVLLNITSSGRKTLEYFSGLIPQGIKSNIDSTFAAIRKNIKNETLITADFLPESENEFIATCKVGEDNFPLMEIKLTVGTKKDARKICENWKKHSQAIYSEIIDIMTKKRD